MLPLGPLRATSAKLKLVGLIASQAELGPDPDGQMASNKSILDPDLAT